MRERATPRSQAIELLAFARIPQYQVGGYVCDGISELIEASLMDDRRIARRLFHRDRARAPRPRASGTASSCTARSRYRSNDRAGDRTGVIARSRSRRSRSSSRPRIVNAFTIFLFYFIFFLIIFYHRTCGSSHSILQ